MSTAVTALLNECEDDGEEETAMQEEEEHYADESVNGQHFLFLDCSTVIEP